MAFKQSIKGDENVQSEHLSHNRLSIEAGGAAFLIVCFLCFLIVCAILFMVFVHLALLETLIVITFIGGFVCLWVMGLGFTIRHSITTATHISLSRAQRESAKVRIISQTDQWALWIDNAGAPHFEATTHVDEHRQFLPAPAKPPDVTEAILTCFDSGMSGRSIEKHLKTYGVENVSYRHISKILDLYRKGWNAKKTVEGNLLDDSDET